MRDRAQAGQVTPLILGLTLVVLAVAGLAIDGTRAFLLRRGLQNAADAAALAGAAEVDTGAYYSSGGERVSLQAEQATRTALGWLARRRIGAQAAVDSSGSAVRVILRGHARTTFLRLAGISEIPVAVEARASPVPGG